MAACATAILTGCATHHPKAEPVYYPPPPDTPRLQFLKSFSTSDDVSPQSGFSRFVLGRYAPKSLAKPYGVAIYSNSIFVCDTMLGAIAQLDFANPKMDFFVPPGPGRLIKPINITIDQDGTRYVADTERSQVMIYDAKGKYLAAIGAKAAPRINASARKSATNAGKQESPAPVPEGLVIKPTDVLVSSNRIFVTDLNGHCVRVFDKTTREPLMSIPGSTTNEEAKLFLPTNLAMDPQARLYVCDTGNFRVKLYDADGNFLKSFGRYGNSIGELARPKGVAVDREGRVYVVDAMQDAAQIFDSDGQLLLAFGQPGSTPLPLTIPAKVCIDYGHVKYFQQYAAPGFQLEYLVLITNQYGIRKVDVYGFGHTR